MDIILELIKDFLNEHIEEITVNKLGNEALNLHLECINAIYPREKHFDITMTYNKGWILEENLELQFLLAFLFIGKDDIELLTEVLTERKEFKRFLMKGE